MLTFGERLRRLRLQKKLSQTQLATRSGVQKGTISGLERDQQKPSWDTVQALADGLGVSCEALMSRRRRNPRSD